MLTDNQISSAIREFSHYKAHHEHHDCIRIAYAWLDAQIKIKSKCRNSYPIKHLIEKWAGRYVSEDDVTVAAAMHPQIFGSYPFFNISSKLTEPARYRLSTIGEAMQHPDYNLRHDPKFYKAKE